MEEKKESEKKEGWLNYLALATVIVALGATLSTLRVGSFSNRSILRQTQASDQWAYYQAIVFLMVIVQRQILWNIISHGIGYY
jgi:hypothetical protein